MKLKLKLTTSPGGWVVGAGLVNNNAKPALTKVEVKV